MDYDTFKTRYAKLDICQQCDNLGTNDEGEVQCTKERIFPPITKCVQVLAVTEFLENHRL